MAQQILVDTEFLQKIAQFTGLVISKLNDYESKNQSHLRKQASIEESKMKYSDSLKKAAKALYDSDYLLDSQEQRDFIQKSAEDPSHVANMIERMCKMADVSFLGKPAEQHITKNANSDDPVYQHAFGGRQSNDY